MLVLSGAADDDWAACLTLDLRSRGVQMLDRPSTARARQAEAVQPGALVVVRSWLPGGRVEPPPAVVDAVRGRHGPYIVARRNWTKLGRDDCPGRTHQFALWDGYYQPYRSGTGRGGGGFANLLGVLLGGDASIDLADGYVFISYHFGSDGSFVHDRLRPVLSRAGLTSWSYRTSERIPDEATRRRLGELVPRAAVLLVVSTPQWWTPWSDFEVRTALGQGVPVVAVRPAGSRPSGRSILADVPLETLEDGSSSAANLVTMIGGASA